MGSIAIFFVVLVSAILLVLLLVLIRLAGSKSRMQQLINARTGAGQAPPPIMDMTPPYKLCQSRHGWMLVNSNDVYLGQAILEYGECCEIEVEFLLQILSIRPGVVIEIGTNIGTHTVPMAKALATENRPLIAFEPQPFIFQNMCANLALNGITNVRAWPWACGAQPGTVYFPLPNYAAGGNFGAVFMTTAQISQGVAVPCVRIDDVIGSEAVSLIKIDVEGFELLVLQGAVDILERSRPVLYVENDRIENSKELIDWLWSKNYQLWWHIPPLFNPENYFGNQNDQYHLVSSFNMLCLPRELNFPVKGMSEITDSSHHPLIKT